MSNKYHYLTFWQSSFFYYYMIITTITQFQDQSLQQSWNWSKPVLFNLIWQLCPTSGVPGRRSFWSRHAGHGCGIAPHALVAPIALVRIRAETELKIYFIFITSNLRLHLHWPFELISWSYQGSLTTLLKV